MNKLAILALNLLVLSANLASAIVPDIPSLTSPTNCFLRVKNDTQLEQPITFGTTNLSAGNYAAISLPNGALGSLSVDCDVLVEFSKKPGAGQILSRNSQTTYVLTLPVVNQAQAPRIPPISKIQLGNGSKSSLFVTSPNPVCVLPASLCQ